MCLSKHNEFIRLNQDTSRTTLSGTTSNKNTKSTKETSARTSSQWDKTAISKDPTHACQIAKFDKITVTLFDRISSLFKKNNAK